MDFLYLHSQIECSYALKMDILYNLLALKMIDVMITLERNDYN